MSLWHDFARRRHALLVVLLVAMVTVVSMAAPARADSDAADKLKALDTSLNLIPADAAFYGSMLNNRDQVEAIANSRAWAKIQQMPVVQMGLQMYEMQSSQPDSQAAMVNTVLANPQTQELLALLGDMFSDDVFMYGDADMVQWLELMQEVATATRYGPLMLQISGQAKDVNPDRLQAQLAIAVLAENVDRVKVPGMVLGFRVDNTERATAHLGKLEAIAGILLANQGPEMAEALKHEKIGGEDYLVFTLPGSMIPWDEVPLDEVKELELEEGSVDKLVAKLKQEQLVVAMGLRGNYLLLSIGSSTKPLENLSAGGGLVGRPEMAPLAKYADKPLTSINYVSKEFLAAANGDRRQIDDMVDFVDQVLPSLELTEAQQEQIRKDAKALAAVLKEHMPVVGGMSQISFIADKGIESYRYDWSTQPDLDGSKPLSLLSHVGGSPLLAVVARTKVSVDDYDLGVKWLTKGYEYFKQFAVPKMSDDDREQYEKFAKMAGPILDRLNKTNREKLLPALDGQLGMVVDGQMTSKQYLKMMPATDEAMPMVEPAVILGVSDAELMKEALDDYWNLIKEVREMAAKENPDLAETPLPEPETIDSSYGEIYAFTLPEQCPVDKQVSPNVAVGPEVCVFSLSKAHTERLLKSTPLAAGGVLADADRPMAVAAVFDWAGLLKAARPWIDLGVDAAIVQQFGPEPPEAQTAMIKQQVEAILEVMSVLRTVTSEAYMEDDVMVVHTLTEIRDVD